MLREEKAIVRVSPLGKTWILDLDGTLVKHNGYKLDGEDSFLDGAEEFLHGIPQRDMIIFVTSRTEKEKELTERFLTEHQVRYDVLIYNAPYGERILVNDAKPSGLITALAFSPARDELCKVKFEIDESL